MSRPLSVYLDLLRFAAAALVFLTHFQEHQIAGPLPVVWRIAGIGNDAVIVFFVLSGFVIAFVADKKEHTIGEYAVSRFARLYSVAIPALFLTMALDYIGSHINPSLYVAPWYWGDIPGWRLMANLFFMNELWFSSVQPFSNGPYWSLGYEFWYYVLFAVTFYLRGAPRLMLCLAFCLIVGPKILILLPVWCLGVVAYHFRPRVHPWVGWIMLVGSLAAYVAFRHSPLPAKLDDWTVDFTGWGQSHDWLQSYVIGGLLTVNLLGARAALSSFPFARVIRYIAGFTFGLYLFHYPLLLFMAAVGGNAFEIVLGTLVSVWALGTVTEQRKDKLKRWFARLGTRPQRWT